MTKQSNWLTSGAPLSESILQEALRTFAAIILPTTAKETKGVLVGGVVPAVADGLLLKIIGRISRLNMNYANLALEGTELNQIEEFWILVTIRQEKNPKKTEAIYANLFELSSGTDMLARMKKEDLSQNIMTPKIGVQKDSS